MSSLPLDSTIRQSTDTDLFDAAAFEKTIKQAQTHTEYLAVYKHAIQALDQELNKRFMDNTPINSLVTGRAFVIDQILIHAWRKYFGDNTPQIALIAVGGYGRGELHPKSDIDLLILLKKHNDKTFNQSIQDFLTFLWDIKLEVGQSVRSIKDCVKQSKADITVATNMMESRLLVGEPALFSRMQYVIGPKKIWPSKKFFTEKLKEQQQRHHKYHDTAYNLEPNVKEGPGGLRDIQTIGWVAKRHFGVNTLQELIPHGVLNRNELTSLYEGQATLWKIRFALHMITGKSEDRILFDYQRELAELFGYKDTHIIAVEQFMQNYFQTVMQLERLNEMLLQHFQETILELKKFQKTKLLNQRFQNSRGFLEIANDQVFEKTPAALLEIFLLLQTEPALKGIKASTIRTIRDSLHLIDDNFRANPTNRKRFITILKQSHGVTHVLRRMNRYGVLGAYLPEFKNIVGRMQYDLFHHYTVDEHTLFVVRNMRRFTVDQYHHEFPLCSDLIKQLPNQVILYIAGLYHDIAKGRGGDHSKLGAIDARLFCINHFFSQFDAALVEWLVRHHLIMSVTAQRKDINDPAIINDFASFVGDKLHLDYLYLLTVADIRATNPDHWNSWKASLLEELYRSTKNALQRGLNNPIAQQERMNENIKAASAMLEQQALSQENIQVVWKNFSKNYFLRHHPQEIAWHTRQIIRTAPENLPIVSIHARKFRGSTPIFVYSKSKPSLFFRITLKLEQLNVNILDARVMTTKNDYALNTFLVLDYHGRPISDPIRLKQIRTGLRQCLLDDTPPKPTVQHLPRRQIKFMNVKTKTVFELDKKGQRTILKVIAADRPGLLSRIAHAFYSCNINLQNARVSSFGEIAEDTFVITNQHGQPLETEETTNLEELLHKKISE